MKIALHEFYIQILINFSGEALETLQRTRLVSIGKNRQTNLMQLSWSIVVWEQQRLSKNCFKRLAPSDPSDADFDNFWTHPLSFHLWDLGACFIKPRWPVNYGHLARRLTQLVVNYIKYFLLVVIFILRKSFSLWIFNLSWMIQNCTNCKIA